MALAPLNRHPLGGRQDFVLEPEVAALACQEAEDDMQKLESLIEKRTKRPAAASTAQA